MTKSTYLNLFLKNIVILMIAAGFAESSQANWTLQPSSSHIHFLSVKATHIGEVHSFTKFSGNVKDDGQATLNIDLASVDTQIPIRDQRMRDLLFVVNDHPMAVIKTKIGIKDYQDMIVGSEVAVQIEASLDFKGISNQVTAEAIVSRQSNSTFTVQSKSPLLLSATNLGITEGIEKLREIAGLTNISFTIPTSFRLTFEKN